jgi:undecaprenyl-diphosphatase
MHEPLSLMLPDITPTRPTDRREHPRTRFRALTDLLFRALRSSASRANTLRLALGLFVLVGATLAVLGTWAFAEIAEHVRAGRTQAFDDAVLTWVGSHRTPLLEQAMLEITFLGTGSVVVVMVSVAALFLWLTRHHYSAILLLVATLGGLLLNSVLKATFDRPRPQLFSWGTHALTSSFPSGHAMSAAVVYGTVAYLAARLQRRRWARALTLAIAAVLIVLICLSRLFLGVHYPSDVIAGVFVGLAWAGFCMATLEAFQKFARRHAPEVLQRDEVD